MNETREQLRQLDQEVLVDIILELREVIVAQEGRIQNLEDQLAKNSRNSHQPPSSDGLKRPKSLRKTGKRKSGGQAGHEGQTLAMVAEPDYVVRHAVGHCQKCQTDLRGIAVARVVKRQVFDVPPVEIEVTEHQGEVKICPCCGAVVQAQFPAHVLAPVQYGLGLQAQAVYLNSYQLLPLARIADLFADWYGQRPSEALIVAALKRTDDQLDPALDRIHAGLIGAEVVNYDETPIRVATGKPYLHVASTPTLTYYLVHPRRGDEAMLDMGILSNNHGWAVHDGLKAYFTFEVASHALCNAHHLRELQFLVERYQQDWAQQMIELLLEIKQHVANAPPASSALPLDEIQQFEARYDALIEQGFQRNPIQPRPEGQPGRSKQSPATNMLIRLQTYREATLAFMHDWRVPFDNNLAERDLRMMKVKQKISGRFRTWQGAQRFAAIRSYISTVRKQGVRVLQALHDALLGCPFLPAIPE